MAIIITKLIETLLEDGTQIDSEKTIYVHPEFCIIKEQFCPDPDDDTFVTIGLGGGTEITKAQLKTRALDIHTRYPFQTLVFGTPPDPPNPPTVTEKTTAEVETMVDDWCSEKNVS